MMSKTIDFIHPRRLRPHEQTRFIKLLFVFGKLSWEGRFTKPVLVDRETHTILDGHHRVRAAIWLRRTSIPVCFVDYLEDDSIQVYPRRRDIPVTKERVLEKASSGKLFPYKTTKHIFLDASYPRINISLWKNLSESM